MRQTFTKLGGALLFMLFLATSSVKAQWTDIRLDFTKDVQYTWSSLSTATTLYIHNDGTVNTTEDGSIGTIRGQYHGSTYGLMNFTASITVPANVKVSYGQNDYGNEVIVTNSSSKTVGTINNRNATTKWTTGDTQNLSTLYYTKEATTLSFSNCNYVGYFAIEALSDNEIAALDPIHSVFFNLLGENVFNNDIMKNYNATKNASHGWHFGTNAYAKVLVGAYSKITLYQCQYGTEANMTITLPDGSTITDISQKTTTDGASVSFINHTGKPGFVTIAFPAGDAYLHGIEIRNYGTCVRVGSTGWSTLSSDNNLDFSADIPSLESAYIVTGTSGSAITTTKINGKIGAGQGILLKATDTNPILIPAAAAADFDTSSNKLVAGTGAAVNYNDGAGFNYVLAADGANAVFQHIVSGAHGSVVIPEGKAYLALDVDPGARTLSFDDETTGISEIEIMRNGDNETFFDLMGRKVAQSTKGLYIVNGKKVIVK